MCPRAHVPTPGVRISSILSPGGRGLRIARQATGSPRLLSDQVLAKMTPRWGNIPSAYPPVQGIPASRGTSFLNEDVFCTLPGAVVLVKQAEYSWRDSRQEIV